MSAELTKAVHDALDAAQVLGEFQYMTLDNYTHRTGDVEINHFLRAHQQAHDRAKKTREALLALLKGA